jgi:hypothetical protein
MGAFALNEICLGHFPNGKTASFFTVFSGRDMEFAFKNSHDIQFVNNFSVIHTLDEFVNYLAIVVEGKLDIAMA